MAPDISQGTRASFETKPAYASLTMIGLAVTVLSYILQKVLKRELNTQEQADVSEFVTMATGAIGLLIAAIGRWRASRPLSLVGGQRTVTVPSIIITMMMLSLSGGCASKSTPLRKALDLRNDYNAAANLIVTAKEQKLISQSAYDQIWPRVKAGFKDVDLLEQYAAEKNASMPLSDFARQSNVVNGLINEFLDWRVKALRKQ